MTRLLSLERHWCFSQGGPEKAGRPLSGFSLFALHLADKRKKDQIQTLRKAATDPDLHVTALAQTSSDSAWMDRPLEGC